MLNNNCQCELCRSIWEELENKGQTPLTRIEAAIRDSFEIPPLSRLHSIKDIVGAPHENN